MAKDPEALVSPQKPVEASKASGGKNARPRFSLKRLAVALLATTSVLVATSLGGYMYLVNTAPDPVLLAPHVQLVNATLEGPHINAFGRATLISINNGDRDIIVEPSVLDVYYPPYPQGVKIGKMDLGRRLIPSHGQAEKVKEFLVHHVDQLKTGPQLMKDILGKAKSQLTFRGIMHISVPVGKVSIPAVSAVNCQVDVDWATNEGVTSCDNDVKPFWYKRKD